MALLPIRRFVAKGIGRCRRGNVSLIAAVAIIPLIFAVGFGVDYGRAMQAETRLNAIADSAALAAVSASMIDQSDTAAVNAATALFNGQASSQAGVTVTSLNVTAPTASSGSLGGQRVATVTYQARVQTFFSGILGSASLPISGTAQANASQPPSINFYVMLDLSPSMLLPTTTTGISLLSNATKSSTWSNGCDFACHTRHIESIPMTVKNTSGRTMWTDGGTPTAAHPINYTSNGWVYTTDGSGPFQQSNGWYTDTWWLARNYGKIYGSPSSIQLRIDAETTAAQNLISFAQNVEASYNTSAHPVSYKMQFYGFNYSTPSAITSSLTDVSSLSTSAIPDLGAQAPFLYNFYYWTSSSTVTNDQDTDFTTMLNTMYSTIPTPGNGSTPSSPQAVLFIVTDGMADMAVSGGNCQVSGRACTQLLSSHLNQCASIKNKGIRVAVLYTEYLASTIQNFGLGFADTVATSNVPYIEQQLQSCASTNTDGSKLYYKVSSNQDISAALTKLFSMAVQTAYLSK